MAVPKKRTSSSKIRMRKAHKKVYVTVAVDKYTGEERIPHHVTPKMFYKGRRVVSAN